MPVPVPLPPAASVAPSVAASCSSVIGVVPSVAFAVAERRGAVFAHPNPPKVPRPTERTPKKRVPSFRMPVKRTSAEKVLCYSFTRGSSPWTDGRSREHQHQPHQSGRSPLARRRRRPARRAAPGRDGAARGPRAPARPRCASGSPPSQMPLLMLALSASFEWAKRRRLGSIATLHGRRGNRRRARRPLRALLLEDRRRVSRVPIRPGIVVAPWRSAAWGFLFGQFHFGIWALAFVYPFAVEDARLRALEAERLKSDAELARLRAHLEPHFLLNTLNAIAGLVTEDPRAARRLLAALGDLLRDASREATRCSRSAPRSSGCSATQRSSRLATTARSRSSGTSIRARRRSRCRGCCSSRSSRTRSSTARSRAARAARSCVSVALEDGDAQARLHRLGQRARASATSRRARARSASTSVRRRLALEGSDARASPSNRRPTGTRAIVELAASTHGRPLS